MSLLRLQDIQVAFGGPAVLEQVNLSIERNERVCLIGRNGEGKSTLLKVISGQLSPDDGERIPEKGAVIAQLPQEVPADLSGSVYDIVASGLKETGELLKQFQHLQLTDDVGSDQWLGKVQQIQTQLEAGDGWQLKNTIETVISKLSLNANDEFSKLSGGVKRRVLLAQALVQEPDILLLDEPTNHLDIASILWLEHFLLHKTNSSLIFITHDRAFLRKLATRIIELDRGRLTSWPGDYDNFLRRKDEALETEATENALFDKRLAQEEAWIRQGIKARRTRNEGRVRALQKMREQAAKRRKIQGKAKLSAELADRSGKRIAEAENLRYVLPDGRELIRDFSTFIQRGNKIGMIGPNGVGKTTLLKLLLGELKPTSGKLKLGTNLQIAYFDQLRNQLDEERSVKDNLDDGAERVQINGSSRHVMGYLKDFLFTPARMKSPVSSLSGGERNRLLLAKVFIKPSNVLVLDEPTNDLDVDTLELLEELLMDYEGTVIVVSHDRDFINNLVTSCIVFDGNGNVEEFPGSYEDWERQVKSNKNKAEKSVRDNPDNKEKPLAVNTHSQQQTPQKPAKLSYKLQRELDALPAEIETIESEITSLQTQMNDPDFFKQAHETVNTTTQQLKDLQDTLTEKYSRWEELEAMI